MPSKTIPTARIAELVSNSGDGMNLIKRGIAIPQESYVEILRIARIAEISPNQVIRRMLDIVISMIEMAGTPDLSMNCAQVVNGTRYRLTDAQVVWILEELKKGD